MKNKENIKNKNNFLVTCILCIILLLCLCYFGINSSSYLKGTSAAGDRIHATLATCTLKESAYVSSDKKCSAGVPANLSNGKSSDGCCPTGDFTYVPITGNPECVIKYNYTDNDFSHTNAQNECASLNYTYTKYETYSECRGAASGIQSKYCINGGIMDSDGHCCPSGTHFEAGFDNYCVHDRYYLQSDMEGYLGYGSGYICASEADPLPKACYKGDDGKYVYGEVRLYGNKVGEDNGYTLYSGFVNETACLAKNTGGYACARDNGNGGTGIMTYYRWTNDASMLNGFRTVVDLTIKNEKECLAKNKCYTFTSGNSSEKQYYWGYLTGDTAIKNVTEYPSATTKEACLANNNDNLTAVDKPVGVKLCNNVTYNGQEQILASVPAAANGAYTLSNNKVTNAGTHSIKAKLNSGYKWSDDSTSDVTFTCIMNKAATVLNFSSNSVTVSAGAASSVTVTSNNSGTITASLVNSSGSSVGSVVLKNNGKITANTGMAIPFTVPSTAGDYKLKVSFTSGSTNYTSISDQIVTVKVNSSGGTTNPTEYTYTATFSVGSGVTLNGTSTLKCKSQVSNKCTLDSTFNIPTASKSGYTFNGWTSSSSCSDAKKTNIVMTSQNVTYTPCFTENTPSNPGDDTPVTEYTVTYNANGGTVSKTSDNVASGTVVTLPTPSRTGYTFNGWYTASSGGTKVSSSYTVTKNVTLYAQWTENTPSNPGDDTPVTKYTVTYNANGGILSKSEDTVESGTVVTLPTPSRTGYTFNGWYTASSGGTKVSSPYTVTKNVTLHAQWTTNSSSGTNTDKDGNVTDNQQTGDSIIPVILFITAMSLIYVLTNYKKLKLSK